MTGGTGSLGRAVLRKFLNGDDSIKVKLLVRANSDEHLRSRMHRLRKWLGLNSEELRDRLEGIKGDITAPRLGLREAGYRELARNVKGIIHVAACTTWHMPLDLLRKVNYFGTLQVAELARSATQEGSLEYFAHVSTAYVAGDRRGVVLESELWEGQKFNNNYERSKFEAEMLVQEGKTDIPTVVLRPSMIIGDSQTGETTNFNVFYYLVKLMVRGHLRVLPTMESALVDVAPSDYVAEAMYEIVRLKSSIGKTYHLCSGRGRTPTTREILDLMTDFFSHNSADGKENRYRCPAMLNPAIYRHFVSPVLKAVLPASKRKYLRNVDLYLPYMISRKHFDITNTMAVLGQKGMAPPVLRDYYSNIFRYCLKAGWHADGAAV